MSEEGPRTLYGSPLNKASNEAEANRVAATGVVSEVVVKEVVPDIIITNSDAKNGQNKCPKCGATDISVNPNTGKLRCNFCRHEFDPVKAAGIEEEIENLEGIRVGEGAQDIAADAQDVMTLKCESCGAEVVINTAEQLQARCHWCRNTLSLNQQIPNGAVPDIVLPFSLTREEAEREVRSFVEKRQFFANTKFKQEFKTDNILGVYLPYMVVDVNGHADFEGEGEHQIRSYMIGPEDHKQRVFDADAYHVKREFDITIHGLTIESNQDKLDHSKAGFSNNVINSIMPFDLENALAWDANYLKGYNSEKRNLNVGCLSHKAEAQAMDVARFKANESLTFYDRGVAWRTQKLDMKGQQWMAAYLPVWLYSYQEVKSNGTKLLHYTAVNARTKETMGSIPVHMPKLVIVSLIIELFCSLLAALIGTDWSWLLLAGGPGFGYMIYKRYRNTEERHYHEVETHSEAKNEIKIDNFITRRKRLHEPEIMGSNNKAVHG